MATTEIGVACFLLGLGLGVSVSFAVAEWMARRERQKVARLCDSHYRIMSEIVDIAYENGVTLEGLKKINEIKPNKLKELEGEERLVSLQLISSFQKNFISMMVFTLPG
jgi:predicted DNA-binding antitoxin AbrB/MazE fold protein